MPPEPAARVHVSARLSAVSFFTCILHNRRSSKPRASRYPQEEGTTTGTTEAISISPLVCKGTTSCISAATGLTSCISTTWCKFDPNRLEPSGHLRGTPSRPGLNTCHAILRRRAPRCRNISATHRRRASITRCIRTPTNNQEPLLAFAPHHRPRTDRPPQFARPS